MICIAPVDIQHIENVKYYHLIADAIVHSLPVKLHCKTYYYRLSTRRPTITHSLSLFPTPLSVKCMNHGHSQANWWKAIVFCWRKQCHSLLVRDTYAAIMFVYGIVWILDSDWSTGVLKDSFSILRHCNSAMFFPSNNGAVLSRILSHWRL